MKLDLWIEMGFQFVCLEHSPHAMWLTASETESSKGCLRYDTGYSKKKNSKSTMLCVPCVLNRNLEPDEWIQGISLVILFL